MTKIKNVAEYIKASQKHANARVSLNPKRARLEQLKKQTRQGTTGNNTAQCTANDFPTPAPKHGPQAVTAQQSPAAANNELPVVGFEVGDDQYHATKEDGDDQRHMEEEIVAHNSKISSMHRRYPF